LNPHYFKGDWDDPGALIAAFEIGLTTGSWNSSPLYELSNQMLEDWLYNQLTGYYMILMDLMLLMEEFGNKWTEHHHHTTTLSNNCSNVGHAIARALHWPEKSPFSPRHTREWSEECHFSNVEDIRQEYKQGFLTTSPSQSQCVLPFHALSKHLAFQGGVSSSSASATYNLSALLLRLQAVCPHRRTSLLAQP
jgi:hypothetical protein